MLQALRNIDGAGSAPQEGKMLYQVNKEKLS